MTTKATSLTSAGVEIFHPAQAGETASDMSRRAAKAWASTISMACDADRQRPGDRDLPLADLLRHPTDGRTPKETIR